MNSALLSSNSLAWTTPRDLFDWLNTRFSFTLDPCCTAETALCPKYYTQEDDGLLQSWAGERVFMNPPYGRDVKVWIAKAFHESRIGALVVGLIPARTDTHWWQDYISHKADVLFIRGRLRFSGSQKQAPFPSAIVTWWGQPMRGCM